MYTKTLLTAVSIGLIFGALTAIVAKQKNKPVMLWFIVGALFGPLGLILALIPTRYNSKSAPPWGYLLLIGFIAIILLIGWKMMYAE